MTNSELRKRFDVWLDREVEKGDELRVQIRGGVSWLWSKAVAFVRWHRDFDWVSWAGAVAIGLAVRQGAVSELVVWLSISLVFLLVEREGQRVRKERTGALASSMIEACRFAEMKGRAEYQNELLEKAKNQENGSGPGGHKILMVYRKTGGAVGFEREISGAELN